MSKVGELIKAALMEALNEAVSNKSEKPKDELHRKILNAKGKDDFFIGGIIDAHYDGPDVHDEDEPEELKPHHIDAICKNPHLKDCHNNLLHRHLKADIHPKTKGKGNSPLSLKNLHDIHSYGSKTEAGETLKDYDMNPKNKFAQKSFPTR